MDFCHKDALFLFRISRTGDLPGDEIEVPLVDAAGHPTEPDQRRGKAALFAEGRLGTFHGGLLLGDDYREPMTGDDMKAACHAMVLQEVEVRRHDVKGWLRGGVNSSGPSPVVGLEFSCDSLGRQALKETESVVESKKRKREQRLSQLTAKREARADLRESLTTQLEVWSRVLECVTGANSNGSTKEDGESWTAFFQRNSIDFGLPPDQQPAWLCREPPLSFLDMLGEISVHRMKLSQQLQKLQKASANQEAREAASLRGEQKRQEALNRKVQTALDSSGAEAATASAKNLSCKQLPC